MFIDANANADAYADADAAADACALVHSLMKPGNFGGRKKTDSL